MPEKIDLNISPYYDDFAEDKKFNKVLFRAGRPLQARELTQSQSIMQNQIERFGSHIFEEGSIVTGAETDIDMELYYVKVSSANPNSAGEADAETYRTSYVGKYLRGKTSGTIGKVINTTAQSTTEDITLFVKWHSQGSTAANSPVFFHSEDLQEVTLGVDGTATVVSGNNNEFTIKPSTSSPIGRSSSSSISEGIVFVRGFFCKVDKQTIILEKYQAHPTYRIGLTITEQVVDSASDTSLLDNSQGTTNENAAGADRLSMALTLSKYTIDTVLDTDFVELARVNQGIIENKITRPVYGQIEQTLARRTFDANGDFVINQFTHNVREHLNDSNGNGGFYPAIAGGDASKFVMQVSAGKAYVKGYEIDKIGSTPLNFKKARTTVSLDNTNTPIRMGNILKVNNVHSLPEFGNETTDTEAYADLKLWDSAQVAADVNSGTFVGKHIGFSRVRNVDLNDGTDVAGVYSATDSIWNLYLFDIKMFTEVSGTIAGTFTEGDRVVAKDGTTVTATGIYNTTQSGKLYLHDVVGTIGVNDAITTEGNNSGTTTVTGTRIYNIDRSRGVTQDPKDVDSTQFVAQCITDKDTILSGQVSISTTGVVSGFGSRFVSELKEGDIIIDGGGNERVINGTAVTDTGAQCTATSGVSAVNNANVTRRRVQIVNQDQTAAIYSWPRDWISKHTNDFVSVRMQQVVTVDSGSFAISSGNNATFLDRNTDNFTIAVVKASTDGSALSVGSLLNIDDLSTSISGSGPQTLTGTLANNNNAKLKITFSVLQSNAVPRAKTLRQSRLLKVGSARSSNGFYGTAYNDTDISLGVADVHKIHAIYEGTSTVAPTSAYSTFTSIAGEFLEYEIIVGQSSGARAVMLKWAGSGYVSYYRTVGGIQFIETEVVVGQTSSASANIANLNHGSEDIKSRYFFDNGQKDGYYDLSKISRKVGEPAPNGPLLIVMDYFTPGAGNFFDKESYASIPYSEIPVYSPNRIDLGGLEPDGTFELSDCVDFRPVVGQLLGVGNTFPTTDGVLPSAAVDLSDFSGSTGAMYAPFGYNTGRFFGDTRTNIAQTSASANDVPVPGSFVVGDISFYVGRVDKVFLHKSGELQISEGNPALTPTKPQAIADGIELFEVRVPAYTKNVKNVKVRSQDHRRFTMGDIGAINNRVTNLERITSLSLLEKDTQTKQILDADGFDRFKSGFLVDNFRGHRVGDVNHPDYQISIDGKLGAMRPKAYSQFFDIALNTPLSTSFQKTGDLITLPYSETSFIHQTKASRSINVNPFAVFKFFGNTKLSPETDIWQDTTQLPEVRINREGNFDAILASNANALGTVWNAWQTTWVGEPKVVSTETVATSTGSWDGDPAQGGTWTAGEQVTRDVTETVESQTRTGVTTSVVEDFVETRNDRVVSVSLIPFMRQRTISITCDTLKPNTVHYFFFDGERIDSKVYALEAQFSNNGWYGNALAGSSNIKSNARGEMRASFALPGGKFKTGLRELRITSSYSNLTEPNSQSSAVYQAQGMLQASQTEITSTRNARVITEVATGERQTTRDGENVNTNPWDEDAPPRPPIPEIPEIPRVVIEVPPPEPPPVTPQVPTIPPPAPADPVPAPLPGPITVVEDLFRVPEVNIDLERTVPRRRRRGWGDPLAQSFLVESAGGTMLTSLEVYFKTKDSHIPVSVELRNMVNGYPGQLVMPFSVVTKNVEDVNVSADGSVGTKFTFDSPVFLNESTEYCFVVYSNSNEYEAFISRMGEKDLATSQTISGQPYAGSLFLSQNASTWTATQEDDLKFHIKYAKFDTTKTASVVFENEALPVQPLQSNPIETFAGESYVKVYSYFHGMYKTTSSVDIAGIKGDTLSGVMTVATATVNTTPTNGTFTVNMSASGTGAGCKMKFIVAGGVVTSSKITDPGSGYTVGQTLTASNFDGGTSDLSIVVSTVGDHLSGIPISAINGTFASIANLELDSFTITPDAAEMTHFDTVNALQSTLGGGNSVYDIENVYVSGPTASRNYYYDTLHTVIPNVVHPKTKILITTNRTIMDSPEGITPVPASYTKRTAADFITLNDNAFFGSPSIVASARNETANMASKKSFTCTLQMQSANPNVSPVIDAGTTGAIAIGNRINNISSSTDVALGTTYVPSTASDGDNNANVYITRKVNLKTPATSLKIIADIFRPPTTDVLVLYKVLKNDESVGFDDLGWTYFNTTGKPDQVTEEDGRNFKEYEWTVDDLTEFTAFSIKIVSKATNTSAVPMVSALRCLGLA